MSNIEEFSAFTKADIEAARNMICKEAPDEIIRLILHRCAQLGCDPLARMIYAVLRKGKWQLQSSIDLFRSIASADADYGGQDGPFWCGQDGIWKDVWLAKERPAAAKVGVYRKGFSAPTYAVANWDAYAVTGDQGFMWNKMPALMLAKTAEALALRKAFPQKLAGLYTNDEMAQADNGKAVAAAPLPKEAVKNHLGQTMYYTEPVALQAAAPIMIELRSLGKQLGILEGSIQSDLKNLGGDVLALKRKYDCALAEKNPRGTPRDYAVATPVIKVENNSVSDNEPAVDGEAGTYTQETVDIISAGIGRDAWDEACREKQDLTEAFKGEAGTLFDRAKEVLSYTQKQTTGEDYLSVDESEELIDRVIRVEAPASEKTQAVMAVMTHAGFETQIPAYEEKMKLCSQVTGKIITAWSQLDPADCAKVLLFLNKTYVGTELATDSEIVQLQIHLKDADLVAYLKKSKAYLAAQEEGATQADSLRNARLAFAGWVLGHPVASFKELTSAEVQTLFTKFQSMKEKV